MRLEFLDRLKENEILGKSILDNEGKILLRAGVKLSTLYIKKLKQLGVYYVYVEDARLDDLPVEDSFLMELKQQTMKSMNKVYRNISHLRKEDMKSSIASVEQLVEHIIETKNVGQGLFDIRTYDNYTYVHCLDTCIMSTTLGISLDLNESKLIDIGISSVLHDIGKIKVPIKIINKDGPLTSDEYSEIKKHPLYGAEILKAYMNISNEVIEGVSQHHERVDGLGYPFGIKGNSICTLAKIVSVCDTYDAVSNDRIYRKKFSPSDAYELIMAGSGSLFDENVVSSFRSSFSIYPLGSCVKLSDGTEGYVVRQNKNFPDRPILRVLYDYKTREPIPSYEIDLLSFPYITVPNMV